MNAMDGNLQSIVLCPISFEVPFYYVMNLPGLVVSSFLIEKYLGSMMLLGLYLTNSAISAGTTTVNHRRIGFLEVRKRGRMSNHNGNITLFLSSILVG